jgi:hypothetical protein
MPASKPLRTIFTYPWDLSDDGIEAALDAIAGAAGLNGVSLAVSYHLASCFLPHNPRRKLFFAEDGMVLFQPPPPIRRKVVKLRPRVSEVVEGRDWLPRLAERIKKRGLHLTAWTVYLYNHHLARTHPACARRDALGNVHPGQLCPANPDVRDYALALTHDVVAAIKPDAFYLESLCCLPFGYGFLNPKILTPLTPRTEFLLGLCFCDHCMEAAGKGLDVRRLATDVAAWLERELPRMPSKEDMAAAADEDWYDTAFESRLQHFLAARAEKASSLLEEVVRTIRAAGDIRIEAEPTSAASLARSGLVAARVNKLLDRAGIGVPSRAEEVTAARGQLRKDAKVLANLQPAHARSEDELARTVKSVCGAGVDGLTFYNYGLVRLEQLRWLGKALANVDAPPQEENKGEKEK